jgi:DNA repair protein RecO (recombination protein O)
MSLYRDEGVVLRTYKLGEADRIVVLLTAGHGKVRAVAKGVRKIKSRFGGRLEPPTHVGVLMYEGRELDIVTQAETIDHFRPIREDLTRMTDAMAMLEAVEQVAQEREANPGLSRMLVGALRTLADRRSSLLVAAFFWKLLSLEGAAPILDRCAGCGQDETGPGGGLVSFDLVEGGALCRDCRRGVPVRPEVLELIKRILGGGLGQALSEPPSAATTEVASLATRSLEQHVERRLRALRAVELG